MATYYYKYTKEKKINATTTRMANVTVMDEKGKEIGSYAMSKWENVDKAVAMLIREYEISKVWNSKEFSFNKKIPLTT